SGPFPMVARRLLDREEQLRAWLAREAERTDVGDHADDLQHTPIVVWGEPAAERALSWEKPARGGFIDDPHTHRAAAVTRLEFTTLAESDAHRVEVPGADGAREDRGGVFQPRGSRPPLDRDGETESGVTEWHARRDCAFLDAGHLAGAGDQRLIEQNRLRGRPVTPARQRDPHRRLVLGIEAGIDAGHGRNAAQ